MTRFDAVIFDCDGVLVDSEVIALEVELAVLAELGLVYAPPEFGARFLGLHDHAFRDALDADSRARLGRPLPADFLERVYARRRGEMAARLQAVAGAADAAAAWPGLRAVASSSRAAYLTRKLAHCGLLELFDPHVYSADLVPRGKPHPDIFLHTAAALAVEPARCLVLEDSANGVLAGRAAGMTVWGFTGGGHCDAATGARLLAAGAERVVCDWPEAARLFEALATGSTSAAG